MQRVLKSRWRGKTNAPLLNFSGFYLALVFFCVLIISCGDSSTSGSEDENPTEPQSETEYKIPLEKETYLVGDTFSVDVSNWNIQSADSFYIAIDSVQSSPIFTDDLDEVIVQVPFLFMNGVGEKVREISLFKKGERVADFSQEIKVEVPYVERYYPMDSVYANLKKFTRASKEKLYQRGELFEREVMAENYLNLIDSMFNGEGKYTLKSALDTFQTVDPEAYSAFIAYMNYHGVFAKLGALGELAQLSFPSFEPEGSLQSANRLNRLNRLSQNLSSDPILGPTALTCPDYTSSEEVEESFVSAKELATEMQSYVLWEQYGTALHESINQVFSLQASVSLVSILKGAGAVPLAITQAIIAWTDFIINKVYLATFPSHLSKLEVFPVKMVYNAGDSTSALYRIEAENTPPGIGIQDMVSLILASLGVAEGKDLYTLAEKEIIELGNHVIGTLQGYAALLNDNHPDWCIDATVLRMPAWRWRAQVYDSSYIELRSLNDSLLRPVQSELTWVWKDSINSGNNTEVFARTRDRDEDLIFVTPPLGIEYNAGIFGESSIISEKVKLYVEVGELKADLEFPLLGLEVGEKANLEFYAWFEDELGEKQPAAGLAVTLNAEGGQVETSEGVTDAQGKFTTLAFVGLDLKATFTATFKDDQQNEFSRKAIGYAYGPRAKALSPRPDLPDEPQEPVMRPQDCETGYARYIGDGVSAEYLCVEECLDTEYDSYNNVRGHICYPQ